MISVRIVPRASRNRIHGVHGEQLKISLRAPPVDGKANEELIGFLAEQLNLHARHFSIINGAASRSKRIHVLGVGEKVMRSRFRTVMEMTHA